MIQAIDVLSILLPTEVSQQSDLTKVAAENFLWCNKYKEQQLRCHLWKWSMHAFLFYDAQSTIKGLVTSLFSILVTQSLIFNRAL